MKQILIACFACLALSPNAIPQNRVPADSLFAITGYANDSLGVGIPDIGVALWSDADSVLIAANITDVGGRFVFQNIPSSTYYIKIGGIYYEHKTVKIEVKDKNLFLEPIILQENVHELPAVSVTAQRPLLKMEFDRIIYNVAADPLAKSASLYIMLQRIPFVTTTGGGIMIKGNMAPIYYINNVPAPTLNKSPIEALKAMKADTVQEIQIITELGAKYDGDFSGGIINIITKKQIDTHLTGTLGATINTRNQYSSTGSFAWKWGNVSFQSNLTFGNQTKYKERWEQERKAPHNTTHHTFIQEKERNYYRNSNLIASALLSWEISENSLWNLNFNYLNLDTRGKGIQSHTMKGQNNIPTYSFGVDEHSMTNYRSIDISSYFQHKWGKNTLLHLMYQFSDLPKTSDDTFNIKDRENYWEPDYHLKQTTHNKEHTLQGDLVYSINEVHKLNGGVKGIARINSGDSDLRERGSNGQWELKQNPDHRFSHRQYVLSVYGEYFYKREPWSFRAGIRDEWTFEHISYLLSPDRNFATNFNDWIITLRASNTLSSTSTVSLNYRSNITRPSIRHLNPAISIQDPSYIYYGNPQLKPQKHHRWSADWDYMSGATMVNVSASYRYSNNSIQADYGVLPNGRMYRSFNNSGRYREAGLSLFTSNMIADWLSVALNGNIFYRREDGTMSGIQTSNSGWTGGLASSFNIDLPRGYYLNLYGGYNFPDVVLEGTGYNFYNCGGTIVKGFLNDRLNISLTAIDFLWNTKKYHRKYHMPNMQGAHSYENYGFLLELGITYKFNTERITAKKTSKRIKNQDVATYKD